MRSIFYILTILVSLPVLSQEYSTASKRAIRYFEQARTHFSARNDAEAEQFLQKALEADERFIEAWFMLAQISQDRNETGKAADYYLKGLMIDPDRNARGFLKLAEVEFEAGRYADALDHLNRWKRYGFTDKSSRPLVEKLEHHLPFAVHAVSNPVRFEPEPLNEAVNTELYEYWPALSVDERTIFFTVLGPPNPDLPQQHLTMQEDFYYATRSGDTWTGRTWLGSPVNTNTNEGAQSVTADGKILYFTACNRSDGHGKMCDIYRTALDDQGNWLEPVNLGNVVNTAASEKHPSISADGRMLIFTSNRSGGKGGYDLWMSMRNGDSWSAPVNLGDSINTPGTEQSPFLHPDQRSLYFSSDGWPGMGKGDVFLSRMKMDGTWSRPVNLGYPINTHNEEVGFIVNAEGNSAYYSSNRREGTDTDIYTFEIPPAVSPTPVSYITGRVYDAGNMRGIRARFQLIDLRTGRLVAESESAEGDGHYLLSLPAGAGYAFNVTHPGYLFHSGHFSLGEVYTMPDPMKLDIPLEPVGEGKHITLNNIFFDTDSYTLRDASRVELDKVLEFMEMNPNVIVEIAGHTDDTGTGAYNRELSEKRAAQVVGYLTGNGIAPERMTSRGYGASMPVADNSTVEGRARNRRTELRIIRVKQ